jgi:uncharacterized protein (DUF305 family)
MKDWYKTLANQEYKDSGNYEAMMYEMNSKMGIDLDKSYLNGMIEHHKGAISMTKKILPIAKSADIKNLANSIVTSQSKEVETLNNWLNTKFQKPSNLNSKPTVTNKHPDGHVGH